MRLHQIKLYFIQRRASIIFFIMALGMFTTLIVGSYLLVQTRKAQIQNQQILKGLSCILLIKPEDRTEEKIVNCIENNKQPDEPDSGFKFDASTDRNTNKNSSVPKPVVIPPPFPVIQTISPPESQSTPPSKPNISPSISEPDQPTVSATKKELEYRVNALGQTECRVIGTTLWIVGECR